MMPETACLGDVESIEFSLLKWQPPELRLCGRSVTTENYLIISKLRGYSDLRDGEDNDVRGISQRR